MVLDERSALRSSMFWSKDKRSSKLPRIIMEVDYRPLEGNFFSTNRWFSTSMVVSGSVLPLPVLSNDACSSFVFPKRHNEDVKLH